MKKNNYKISITLISLLLIASVVVHAQQTKLQFFRPNDKTGLNVFETTKADTVAFDGFKVRLGGDFAMQFQGLNQSNTLENLVELGTDFNLPSANLNLDAQLLDGVRMHQKCIFLRGTIMKPGSREAIYK